MLGFILRSCTDLSVYSLRLLYCSLVRSHIEYASIVWFPLYNIHKTQLDSVQRKFIKYCAYRLNMNDRLDEVSSVLNIHPLATRRRVNDLCFIHKLINGKIDCPYLLGLINLKIPTRSLRYNEVFSVPFHRTSYAAHAPISRSLACLNSEPNIDPFGSSLILFRRSCINSL